MLFRRFCPFIHFRRQQEPVCNLVHILHACECFYVVTESSHLLSRLWNVVSVGKFWLIATENEAFFHTLRFPASLGETYNVRVQLSAKAGAPLPVVCPAWGTHYPLHAEVEDITVSDSMKELRWTLTLRKLSAATMMWGNKAHPAIPHIKSIRAKSLYASLITQQLQQTWIEAD